MHQPMPSKRRRLETVLGTSAKVLSVAVIGLLIAEQASRSVSAKESVGSFATILPAHIRPERIMSISRPVAAVVTSVETAPGERVRQDQVLAVLASPEIDAMLARAQARRDRAQRKWASLYRPELASPESRVFREQIAAAVRALDAAKARLQSVSVTPLEEENARLVARVAQIEKLASQQIASPDEAERVRRQQQDAWLAAQAALDRASRARQEVDAAESQLRVAQLQADAHEKSEIEDARREIEDAQVEWDRVQRQAKELTLTADGAGTIVSPVLKVGDRLQPGQNIFQIADLSSLRIQVPMAAKIARRISKGDPVKVRLPLDPPREVDAGVSNILLVPETGGQSYAVEIVIANPDPRVILAGLEAAVVFPHLPKDGFTWPKLPF